MEMKEGIVSNIKSFLSGLISKVVSILKFGQTKRISLNVVVSEAVKKTKGGNGFVAEYVTAYHLATKLERVGLTVKGSIPQMKRIMESKVKQFSDTGLTTTEIQRAINQGEAIAESMFDSIVNNGKDLVFVEYDFDYTEHEYEINTTGADTGKVTADDIELVVRKQSNSEAEKRILVSLKAYKSSTTSLGSNASVASLHKMFTGVKTRRNTQTDAEFIKFFGPLGKQMLDAMEDYNTEASNFMKGKSKSAKDLRAYWDAKGKKPSKKTGLYPNNLRAQEVGDNYTKKRGYKQEHKLAQLFVKLFNKGKTKVAKSGQEKMFRQGIMDILGVNDSVVTYNAIADDQGVVSEVVNSNTSDGYRKLYFAILNGAEVNLSSYKMKNGGTGIKVNVTYKGKKINGLTLAMWKDGTFQFKFDSKSK
jgi:hypothetical protein